MPHHPEPAKHGTRRDDSEVVTAVVVHHGGRASDTQLALYEETFVEPVRRLNETLSDVLNPDADPDRTPGEALALVKGAVERFAEDTDDWLG